MPQRLTYLFAVTTDPQDRSSANPHSGGWSESVWLPNPISASDPLIANFGASRARLLPGESAIIGFRLENYTIFGNKLLPGGTSTGKLNLPGIPARLTGQPQDALQLSGQASAAPNTNHFTLRNIPDGVMSYGEYQPDSTYKGFMTTYTSAIAFGVFGFIGRDRSQPSAVVNQIAGGVVTLAANVGGVANQDFLRLHRVYDNAGNPVKGSYLITAIAGNAYTLQGLPAQAVGKPSGTARLDKIAFYNIGSVTVDRAVSRKVGRPFEAYRGRRSKTRV